MRVLKDEYLEEINDLLEGESYNDILRHLSRIRIESLNWLRMAIRKAIDNKVKESVDSQWEKYTEEKEKLKGG